MTSVDIVIPTYNRRAELAQCLESVRDQTFRHWRCWIAADGEAEATREAVGPFLADERFALLPAPHTGLPAVGRNRGVARGGAKYVAFLDDDDLWLPEKLETQVRYLEEHPDCALLASNALSWTGGGPWDRSLPSYHPRPALGSIPYETLARDNPIVNSSAICPRAVLDRAGPLDEDPELRAFEDYGLWLRVGALGDVYVAPEPLVVYRNAPETSIRSQTDLRRLDRTMARVHSSALRGAGGVASPLSAPENRACAQACRAQRDRYRAGSAGAVRRLLTAEGLARGINVLLAPFNVALCHPRTLESLRRERNSLRREKEAFAELHRLRGRPEDRQSPHPAECIVFSKDRALQLHALLASFREKVVPSVPIHVLYHAGAADHEEAYGEVRALFEGPDISFSRQRDAGSFRDDLLAILESIRSDKLLFLVDDIVFTEDVDLRESAKYDLNDHVPSLRLGLNLKRSYTNQRDMILPEFLPEKGGQQAFFPWSGSESASALEGKKGGSPPFSRTTQREGMVSWRWGEGQLDWGYPLSVDGHLFSTREIAAMARWSEFRLPNSFEAQLQRFQSLFAGRLGVCYRKSRLLNVPCNRVQTEEDENVFGDVHQDFLLEQWKKGFQMDYRNLYGFVNESAHQEVELSFVKRDA
jgi:GT2 family glycosyltransferase